ncbi:MAG: TIGR04013 family B12-binding domain/radical SAM domain-containing protein [Candidatus Freyarchaeota archaeon]|nr:TIGR04013 family B12-binding domain/radical SAM domain-containing protein [Candidatus Jordarchaeia archaeon]MBS7269021.1 TIGR04013 family B12-binding domain/radical SAM domain-containing protein [Candidatus Jordarchaeia archaeon]MBS7280893.1 TIGR04013 family B12-binding domain/radical SAM domain-containing protein [Candidatus Jordarchaeia archaeon]
MVLRIFKQNWYSFAPLLGALERDKRVSTTPINIIRDTRALTEDSIGRMFEEYGRVVFAYSFFTTQTPVILNELKRILGCINRLGKENFTLVAGGPHATGDVRGTLKMGFDVVVVGPGEASFPDLVHNIQVNEPIFDTPGIAYLLDNEVVTNKPKESSLDEFYGFSERFDMFPPIEISRGCPHGCKYCEVSYIFGRKMLHRSLETVKKHVEAYEKRFRNRRSVDIRFISPNSLCYGSQDGKKAEPKAIEGLLRTIKSYDNTRVFFCTFPSEGRPENFDEEVAGIISEYCSNKTIAIGAQSGSNRILKLMNRGHTVEDVYAAVDCAAKNGLGASVDFLLGFPSETREDQYKTYEVIKNLLKRREVKARLHYFIPLVGTPLAKSKPAPLDKDVLRDLYEIGRGGRIWGFFDSQIKASKRISDFQI